MRCPFYPNTKEYDHFTRMFPLRSNSFNTYLYKYRYASRLVQIFPGPLEFYLCNLPQKLGKEYPMGTYPVVMILFIEHSLQLTPALFLHSNLSSK